MSFLPLFPANALPTTARIMLLFFFASLISCTNAVEDQRRSVALPESALARTNAEIQLTISFESESVSFSKVDGKQPAKEYQALYRVKGVPIVKRNKVEGVFLKNGIEEWTFTNLEPTIRIPTGKDGIPADDSPQVSVTKIKNGTAFFYDRLGQLLYQSDFPSSNLDYLKQIITQADSSYASDVEKQLSDLQRKGSIITDLGNEVVSVKTKINASDYYPASASTNSAPSYETMALIDKKNGLMIGNALYDHNGLVLQQMFYRYRTASSGDKPVLEAQHSEGFNVDNNNIRVKTISDITYSNFKIKRF